MIICSKQKNKWKQVLFFCVSMTVMFAMYYFSLSYISTSKYRKLLQTSNVSTDYNILYQISAAEAEPKSIRFSGQVIRRNSRNKNITLILKPANGSEELIMPTMATTAEKAFSVLSSEDFFEVTDFTAKWKKKLDATVCYELQLFLEYESEQKTEDTTEWIEKEEKISTGKYFYNGKLYSYNPLDYVSPQIENAEFLEAVEKGNILAYNMEKECWIYEYNKELYCIFNFSLFGTMEQRPEIPVFIRTFQEDKLPDHRKESKEDYIAYYLTEKDYEQYKNEKYFLYKVEIPTEYMITSISTGVYQNHGENKGWIWKTFFVNSWTEVFEK